MKTTVEIADSLFDQTKALATQENLTLRSLIEEGLRKVIVARTAATAKAFRLRDGSFRSGLGLQPGVDWKDLTSLAYADDGSRQ